MGGLFGFWDLRRREPSAAERTIMAIVIFLASAVSTAVLVFGVAELMFFLMPTQH